MASRRNFFRLALRMATWVLLAVMLTTFAYSRMSVATEEWIEQLASLFIEITTGREYEKEEERNRAVGKWDLNAPITYMMLGEADQFQREVIQNHLAELNRITGLQFQDVGGDPIYNNMAASASSVSKRIQEILLSFRLPNPSWRYVRQVQAEMANAVVAHLIHFSESSHEIWWRAQLLIVVSDINSLVELGTVVGLHPDLIAGLKSETNPCAGLFRGGEWSSPNPYIIKTAAVFLPNHEPSTFTRCVIEELTQVLGLPNDSPESLITRFNERLDGSPELTPFDKLFLRILYNSSVTPGLPRQELRARIVPLIEEELFRNPSLAQHPAQTKP